MNHLQAKQNGGLSLPPDGGFLATQVQVANAYPRKFSTVVEDLREIICIDNRSAEECIYLKPVSNKLKNSHKGYVTGYTVKMAMNVASQWKHIQRQVFIKYQDDKLATVCARAWDMQANNAYECESIVMMPFYKNGGPNHNLFKLQIEAEKSKLERNAIFKVVPNSLLRSVEKDIEQAILSGDIKSKKNELLEFFSEMCITREMISNFLGTTGRKSSNPKDIVMMVKILNAIGIGTIDVDDVFPGRIKIKAQQAKEDKENKRAAQDQVSNQNKKQAEKKQDNKDQEEKPQEKSTPAEKKPLPSEMKKANRRRFQRDRRGNCRA